MDEDRPNQQDTRTMEEQQKEKGPDDVEVAEDDYTMETASEVASPGIGSRSNLSGSQREEAEQYETMEADITDDSIGKGLGVTALILSICSLFFLPVFTGGAGIILGIFAVRRDAAALGWWAAGIGAFSIAVTMLFAPLF
ncbi:DUF4190 domain-containing protein [Salibacterium halotolerans]|uniref:DUF4190 domain-containing protein n=1 Tax=Salibacterium halotolerans TaxID=1884432 RepID=A0A1I5NIV0_9BACI|nr:DUF4190 domain-containing protein [Salibacterium halotolerans]SFP21657.1 hypothetical protein SAMN05518683_103161 [Salibacterium halotolerans]